MRYVIMGYSGSGKSTLTRFLGDKYNIPTLHLDAVQFYDHWQERTVDDQKKIVRDFLDHHHKWAIDGNYSSLYLEERLEKASMIIIFHFNRWNCLYRVIKRYIKYFGKTRPDMGKGCKEKIDFEFIKWILYDGRSKKVIKRDNHIIEKYHHKVIIIHNQKELNEFMMK